MSPAAVSVDRYGFIEKEEAQPQRTDLGLRLHDSLFSNTYFVCSCLMCFAWRLNQKIEKRTLHIVHSGILCLPLSSILIFCLSYVILFFYVCMFVSSIKSLFFVFCFWSAAGGAGDGPDHVFVGGLP